MIHGERVTIGPVLLADKEILFNWINDANLVRLNAPFKPVDWKSHTDWFESIGRDPSKIVMAIRNRGDSKLIGSVQLFSIHQVHRSAELSIRIGEVDSQGKGLGTESLKLLLRFAFNDLNLNRVYLHVLCNNDRAIACYRKVGFKEEGRLRKAAYINGEWADLLLMAILKND